jgi:hypothetical protein
MGLDARSVLYMNDENESKAISKFNDAVELVKYSQDENTFVLHSEPWGSPIANSSQVNDEGSKICQDISNYTSNWTMANSIRNLSTPILMLIKENNVTSIFAKSL